MKIYIRCLVLWVAIIHCVSAQNCDLSTGAKVKEFPDLNKEGRLSYQLSVQFTITNKDVRQTDFFREYYDIQNKKGRVDMVTAGNTAKYYYFKDTSEAFVVQGDNCTSVTLEAVPDFLKTATTDWQFQDVRGPSAMFLTALGVWKNKFGNMAYMGEVDDFIRGLKAQYWRRCLGSQVIDYYFTVDEHDDAYGFDKLKQIPLRVSFSDSGLDAKFLPQTYDIISFKPFVSDRIKTFEVPTGIGCRRSKNLTDVPTVPDFSGKNLLTFGEASYVYGPDTDQVYNYYSTFIYAMDVKTDHMAYFYTTWGGMDKQEQTQDAFVHITYDMKNKYIYKNDLSNDTCTIARQKSFFPRYYLPRFGGYIDLTDPMVLYPNNEFRYIADGKDRGYDVHIFEAVMENYSLGNRTFPKVIVNHNYLKDTQVIDNVVQVKNATISAQFKFFADKSKLHSEQLAINFYGFTTEIQHPQFVFSVASCMKNDDDFLFVTIGFAADKKVMEKIKTEVPSIEDNILSSITLASELNPLRIPTILVDFDDLIYATLTILDKPPVILDFLEPETGYTISGTSEVEGIKSLDGCASSCLELDMTCWAFAYCGSTCYYANSNTANVIKKEGCTVYRRYDNDTYVPSKASAADNLKKMVATNQLRIAIPSISGQPNEMPQFLEASYFQVTSPGESEEIFGLLGKQTNPRLRVVKAGYKLDKTGEKVKNFGKLRYDECQRLCLDYRRCETVSYCVKDSQCVLSLTHADDLPKDNIVADSFCNLLTRKYADHFERSGGNILSTTARKVLPLASPEDCAKMCLREKSFSCLSFDLCPASETSACRLHDMQLMDVSKETGVTKETACGHYAKKYSYHYKKEDNKKSVGVGYLASTNITLEQCAKLCDQIEKGTCYGYDYCGDKTLLSTACYILNDNPDSYKTSYSAICNHYLQKAAMAPGTYTAGNVAWVGALTFFIAAVVGVLLTFGIAYYRANRAQ